jgi:hypothetical protein
MCVKREKCVGYNMCVKCEKCVGYKMCVLCTICNEREMCVGYKIRVKRVSLFPTARIRNLFYPYKLFATLF